MLLKKATILIAALLAATVFGQSDESQSKKDYGMVKRSPTEKEMSMNAVVFYVGDGFRCQKKATGNETARPSFTEVETPGQDECVPARWTDWHYNCNGESDVLSTCDGDVVRADLSTLKFTGEEDCFLLTAAVNSDDEVMMEDLKEECKEFGRHESGATRRLDYVTSCPGYARRYLANWYIKGAHFFHFHARNLLDNIKSWGNCGSGDYDVYSGRPTFHSIGIEQALGESVYEGNYLWNCESQTDAFVRVLGNLAYFEGKGSKRTGSTDCTEEVVGDELHLYPSSGDRCYSGISWDPAGPSTGLTPTIPVIRSGYGGSSCF